MTKQFFWRFFFKSLYFLSAAMALSGLFFASKSKTGSFSLNLLDFNVEKVRFYPWCDMAENVINALNISKGLVFYKDIVVNHMPGVYQYLSLFFTGFGASGLTPSPMAANFSYFICAIAVAAWALFWSDLALKWIGFAPAPRKLIAALLVLIAGLSKDLILPMSEVFIFYLQLAQMACLWRQIQDDDHHFTYLQLFVLIPCNLWLGLTMAPVMAALIVVSFGLLVLKNWRSKPNPVQDFLRLPRNTLLIYVAGFLGVALYSLKTLDLSQLFFWSYKINRDAATSFVTPIRVIAEHFSLRHEPYLHGQLLPQFLLVAAGFLWQSHRRFAAAEFRKNTLFVAILLVLFFLGHWRVSQGYKAVACAGGTWILLFLWIKLPLENFCMRRWVRWGGIAAMALSLCLLVGMNFMAGTNPFHALSKEQHEPEREKIFDELNVCKAGQFENCRCLVLGVFNPQFFLSNNVESCPRHYSSFCPLLFTNPQVSQDLFNLVQNPQVITLNPGQELLESTKVSTEIIQHLNSRMSCQKFAWKDFPNATLCVNN